MKHGPQGPVLSPPLLPQRWLFAHCGLCVLKTLVHLSSCSLAANRLDYFNLFPRKSIPFYKNTEKMNASVHREIVNLWYHSYAHQYTKVHICVPLMIQDVHSIKSCFLVSQISESIVLSIGTQVKKAPWIQQNKCRTWGKNILFTMLFTFIKPQLFFTMLWNTAVVENHRIVN